MTRLATGITGFDAMVQGGLPVGSSVVLQGPPGQEKLRFALTFLAEGLKSGGSGLVVIASQSPDAVLGELRNLGVNLDSVTKENRLRIVDWYSWSEETVLDIEDRGLVIRSSIDLTNLGVAVSRAIAGLAGEKPRRGVIELLSPAMNVYELTQVYAFAQSAKKKFDRYQFTSLVLLEKDMHSGPEITTLHQPFDGVIEIERIRAGDEIVRKVGVLHLKETSPDPTFRVIDVTESGMRVVRDTPKPSPTVPSVPAAAGTVLESQEERARRLTLIMQIASERLKLNARDADALFAMAAAQATLDDPRGGLQTLDRLADLDPAYPGLWVLKTKLHARLGEADRARQSRLRGQQLEPQDTEGAGQTVPCPMCDSPVALDAMSCGNCGVKFAATRNLEEELEDLGHAAIQDMVQEEMSQARGAPLPPKVGRKPAEPEARPASSPEPEVPLSRKTAPKPNPKKGLTNGLVLQRGAGRRTGMTNGLKGRTNGLRGRTNGLTNGLGRTNGLTNGVGRTNGLTNGLGRTNGLTNGLGRTNGLTNGLGRTNGLTNGLGRTNGLTNGLGRTNGLTNGLGGMRPAGFRSSGFRGMMQTAGWKLYVIPLVVVGLLLMPLFLVPEYNGPMSPIRIDGQFGDWSSVTIEGMGAGVVPNPNVDVVRFGVVNNLGPVAFYVQVAGTALQGGGASPGTMDTVRIFVDTDGSSATGYRIDGLGADRLIEVSGYGGAVRQSTLWEFDANRDTKDWGGWIKGTGTPAAASGSQIEAEAEWLTPSGPALPVVATVHTASWNGQDDIGDFPISPSEGSLSVVADPLVPDVISGNGISLLRLTIAGHGQAVSIDSLQVQIIGTAAPTSALTLRLMDGPTVLAQAAPTTQDVGFRFPAMSIGNGSTSSLSVVGDFAATGGDTFGIHLPPAHPFGLSAGAVGLRENPGSRTVGYLGSAPSMPRVDGGFDEWLASQTDPANDVSPQVNPSIDLLHEGTQASGGSTFLYADVSGRILRGTSVPELAKPTPVQSPNTADTDRDTVPDTIDPMPLDFNNDGVPDAQTNGDYDGDNAIDYGFPGGSDYWLNTTLPTAFPPPFSGLPVSVYIGPTARPPVLGEDVFRMFIDIDNSTWSGYSISGIGADRLIEIRGKDNAVTQSASLSFSGSFPGQWAWTPISPVTIGLGYHSFELSVPWNATSAVVDAGDFWGSVDSTTASLALVGPSSTFTMSPANTPLSVPWAQVGPQPSATLVDGGSNSISTLYNHQRKVVRAGDVSGQTACDATNSDGCWYVVFHDQVAAPDSAFKDGASAAIPTTLGLLDSITTSIGSGDNLVIAAVQISNTGGSTRTISAGNLQIRRGSVTTDPLISQTQFDIKTGINGGPSNGLFTVLLGKDANAPVNPTYGLFAFADSTGVNAEIKILVLNNIPATASGDGASVAVGTTETTLLSQSTTLPAGDNTVIASVQFDSTGANTLRALAGNVRLKRGSTVLASNEFYFGVPQDTFRGDGGFALLIATDVGAPVNPTYTVTALRDGTLGAGNGEAKLLAFNGVTSSVIDTGSVAISSTRTVIGAATTSFGTGDDAIIGAIQLQNTNGAQETIAAGADDIRRTGDSLASSNTFSHALEASGSTGSRDIQYQFYVRKVTTSAANPSYEGAATDANAAVNGELKLVAIHIRDTNEDGWDRVIIMRSSDTTGSTWGSQIVLASGQSSDSPLLYPYDSSEPSIAIDSSGFLHLTWVSASAAGDQSTLDRVRYARTTVAYPTQAQLASAANWEFGETTSYYPGTETITTGSGCGGTFPTDIQSSNNVYRCYREANTGGTGAIAFSNLGSSANPDIFSTTDGSSFADTSWTPPTSGLIIVYVSSGVSSGTANQPTISGNSLTWTAIKSLAVGVNRLTLFGADAAGSTAGVTTIDFAGQTQTGCAASFYQATNIDLTGGVAAAFVQSPTGSGTGTSGSITLAAAGNSNNRPTSGWYHATNEAVTPRTNWVEMDDAGYSTPAARLETQERVSAFETTAGASWSTSSAWIGIAAELKWWSSNYQIEIRHDWSAIPTDGASYEVCIEAYIAGAGGESMLVQVLTAPSTWNTRITVTKTTDDNADQCYTLTTAEFNSGSPSIRWIGGTETGDTTQSDINIDQERVIRHSVKIVDDANPGFMPTVSTDTSNNPHIAWSGSKTSGTVYYKNKAGGTWRATVSWGTTYTGLSVDVSPQNNYVSLARYFESATNEIQYTVCKDLSTSNCDASSEFTKWNGAAGFDTVATSVETGAYPSLVTTYEANGDLWIAYAKDVDGTTRAIYARFLDYPSNGFGVAETVDSLTGTQFTRPTIGVDKDGNVHALYVAMSGPQLYYKLRTGGGWGSRTAVDSFSDHASLMARAPNNPTYGIVSGAAYWKSSTSETYFYYIPEFETVIGPIMGVLALGVLYRRKVRMAARPGSAPGPSDNPRAN